MERPNCMKCKHYHSTYEPNTPRGCRVYGFKSMAMPSVLVKNESGKECQAFTLSAHLEKKNEEKEKFNFNRKDYW